MFRGKDVVIAMAFGALLVAAFWLALVAYGVLCLCPRPMAF